MACYVQGVGKREEPALAGFHAAVVLKAGTTVGKVGPVNLLEVVIRVLAVVKILVRVRRGGYAERKVARRDVLAVQVVESRRADPFVYLALDLGKGLGSC